MARMRETHRVGNNNNASVNAVGERGGCFTRFPTMVHPVAAEAFVTSSRHSW